MRKPVTSFLLICLWENEQKVRVLFFSSPLRGEDKGEGKYLCSKHVNSFDKEA